MLFEYYDILRYFSTRLVARKILVFYSVDRGALEVSLACTRPLSFVLLMPSCCVLINCYTMLRAAHLGAMRTRKTPLTRSSVWGVTRRIHRHTSAQARTHVIKISMARLLQNSDDSQDTLRP